MDFINESHIDRWNVRVSDLFKDIETYEDYIYNKETIECKIIDQEI